MPIVLAPVVVISKLLLSSNEEDELESIELLEELELLYCPKLANR